MDFGFLLDDWRKIPQNIRYIFVSGGGLILITWVTDHWGGRNTYKLFGWDFRNVFFSLGVSLIVFGLLIIVLKQLSVFYRIAQYRKKYPIKELRKSFYLVWFTGQLILFDKRNTVYYHITPLETAQDLYFEGQGFVESTQPFDKVLVFEVEGTDVQIRMSDYSNGGQINTRR
ncbi:MAG TPA: hypothetical protein VFT53_06795 [Candidatus Saccharimonadales bacterium]|nr:hypothetical protein [Candidatus Saccharimonadales bacterium]